MHIPQCFLVSSLVFHLVLSRQFMFFKAMAGWFPSSHFRFAVLLFVSLTVLAFRFRASLRERRRGALELVCFWVFDGPVPWVTPLHTQHNDSAARSHTGAEEMNGATRGSILVCIRIQSFFWPDFRHHGFDFYPTSWGFFTGQQMGREIHGLRDGFYKDSARNTWVLALGGKLVKHCAAIELAAQI